jgi:hypothetical protein
MFLTRPARRTAPSELNKLVDLNHPLVKLAECGSGPCSMLRSSRLNRAFSSDELVRSLSETFQTRDGLVLSFGTRITSDFPVQNLSSYWPITVSARRTAS